jgi:hypothetical protein
MRVRCVHAHEVCTLPPVSPRPMVWVQCLSAVVACLPLLLTHVECLRASLLTQVLSSEACEAHKGLYQADRASLQL